MFKGNHEEAEEEGRRGVDCCTSKKKNQREGRSFVLVFAQRELVG